MSFQFFSCGEKKHPLLCLHWLNKVFLLHQRKKPLNGLICSWSFISPSFWWLSIPEDGGFNSFNLTTPRSAVNPFLSELMLFLVCFTSKRFYLGIFCKAFHKKGICAFLCVWATNFFVGEESFCFQGFVFLQNQSTLVAPPREFNMSKSWVSTNLKQM